MPFIIPLGHEYIRKRVPRATIALIIINTVLYFLTFSIQIFQAPGAAWSMEKLNFKEYELFEKYLRENKGMEDPEKELQSMEPLERHELFEEFRRDMEDGKVVDRDSEEYIEWKSLFGEHKKKMDNLLFRRFGLRPAAIKIHAVITYAFLHGDFWHLLWNMYFLWLVGCNIEDVWGRRFFIGVYLAGAVFSGMFHSALYFRLPQGDQPLIGASGAVAAIMGAFLVRYWKSKIRFLIIYWIVWIPAWVALPAWFAEQLYYGIKYMYMDVSVAFWAHIGGFVFGAAVAYGFERSKLEEKSIARELEKQDEKDKKRMEEKRLARMTEAEKRPVELMLGIEARKIGRYDEAREILEKAVELYSHDFDVHFELQQVYHRMGLMKEANIHQGVLIGVLLELDMTEAALERYLLLEKADPDVSVPGQGQYRMARLLEERGMNDSAALAYRRFAAANPEDRLAPKALFQCGSLLLDKLGRPEHAAQMFEYIIRRYPEAPGREIVEESLKRARKKLN